MVDPSPGATFPFEVERIAHEWIQLDDGIRLAARRWQPVTDRPVPAILEAIPYRKGDYHAHVDEQIGSWFAGHGYAYVRVDMRGSGDSDGILTDEYSVQETDDSCEAIAWLAEQPWCDGAVGMIGISWGGIGVLVTAARRPPALGAVISMCAPDDRYADDVHYYGGCVLAWEMLPWASVMLTMNALPPDPETVGGSWRDTWMDRLDRTPPFLTTWMEHQRRDAYWKHGSVIEDADAIECPVWMVGGWSDGYTNAIPRTLAGLRGERRGLIGPWAHQWPQNADAPSPPIGFLQEAIAWWDRWLKGEAPDVDRPFLQAWIRDPVPPERQHLDRPGRWVAESSWPPSTVRTRRLFLVSSGALSDTASGPGTRRHRGSLRHGLLAGEWCPAGAGSVLAPEQREEDALALTFDGEPLSARLELLGRPLVHLTVAADRPAALVSLRLCDVAPDGTSTLLTRGALNLTHRESHEHPEPLTPGTSYEVEVELDVIGQAVVAGHRLRLAISSTYWPWLWPSPEPVELSIATGDASWLELPVRSTDEGDGPVSVFGPAERGAPLGGGIDEGPVVHHVDRDLTTGVITVESSADGDAVRTFPDGLAMTQRYRNRFIIREDDPLSARVEATGWIEMARARWRTRVETTSSMSADAVEFHLVDTVEAFEGDDRIFNRTWERSVPRDHV